MIGQRLRVLAGSRGLEGPGAAGADERIKGVELAVSKEAGSILGVWDGVTGEPGRAAAVHRMCSAAERCLRERRDQEPHWNADRKPPRAHLWPRSVASSRCGCRTSQIFMDLSIDPVAMMQSLYLHQSADRTCVGCGRRQGLGVWGSGVAHMRHARGGVGSDADETRGAGWACG
jgi:hypothetical protein